MIARKIKSNQYPAYAVKSDDGAKDHRNQYPAYAVKSDDGPKDQTKPISCLCRKKR